MEKEQIIEKLTTIFRTIFNDNSLVLVDDMTASDVENWDSLSHMLMISDVENVFSIKFKLKELNNVKNVGNLILLIKTKLVE